MNCTDEIGKAFNKQAREYEQAAKMHQEIGSRLLERLDYLSMSPQRILDLGCGTGVFSKQLAKKYPKAQIIGLDLAEGMLKEAKRKHGFFRRWPLVRADMHHLPFASGSFDLVFSNQAIHWAYPLVGVFREINRVLRVNGCLMCTTLGPDTFKELKSAWSGVDTFAHVNEFMDMHDVGDVLMSEHFLEPVIDMEMLSMHYESLPQLLASLKKQGVKNINPQRNHGLTGKKAWHHMAQQYESLRTENHKLPLTYEVVYGHAWKGEQRKTDKGVETLIPVSKIVRNR